MDRFSNFGSPPPSKPTASMNKQLINGDSRLARTVLTPRTSLSCRVVPEFRPKSTQSIDCSHDRVNPWRTVRVRRLSRDNRIKQRRAWLLLGWVTAERFCPCKQPNCTAIAGGSEVTFKPLVPSLSVREGFLALTSSKVSEYSFHHGRYTDSRTRMDRQTFLNGYIDS
ncbi:hypothetical protein J6590_003771 [Homalodisca vitripennis]|nr:hypothetical protein J6590_003771 [Homalodisca vitripennis]